MAKILYVYNDQVYANITNKCDCNCTFCIRKQFEVWVMRIPSGTKQSLL